MEKPSCFTEFIKYAALNVLGMLGISCYILADTVLISRGVGADGLAALNLAIPVYSFIHGSGLMMGMGGATRYAVLKGQEAHEAADRLFTCIVYAVFILAAVFMVLGGFFSGRLAAFMGAQGDVFEMTDTYIGVILLFAPAFMMNDLLICFIRNDGAPGLSMLAMVGGSLFNIVFDYLFIFPAGLGIFGAVLATGISPLVSIAILSMHFWKKKNSFRLRPGMKDFSMLPSAALLGVPSLITEMSSGIVIMVFNAIILKLQGNTGVAAYGVIANLSLVVIAIYTGLAQGMQPIVSRAFGQGDKKTPQKTLRYGMISMALVSVVIYGCVFLWADPIAAVFNRDADALLQEIAVYGLKIYFAGCVFAGFNIVLSFFFTSMEKAVPAQMISALRGFVLMIPMAFLLSALFGITGVWLAFPVTEGLVSIIGIFLQLFRGQSYLYNRKAKQKERW